VLLRDGDLLLFRVPGEVDDLHAVTQRRRHRVEHVRRGHEQHAREIERDVEIVVAERAVLLGVEHLEQRGRRIPAEIHPELVDLVQHEDRVLGCRHAAGPG
jgi:hypothetical protein